MGDSSAISWTDATFNPWWGCEKVSPACAHCYAERDSNRYGERDLWGAGHRVRFLSDANWRKPLLWAAKARDGLLPDGSPLPDGAYGLLRRPRVFTASMADVFEDRPDLVAPRARLLDLIVATPELDWLVLTKRPEVALRVWDEIPPNVWMGVSIENAAFTWRADVLREIPARIRFLSCEPLLGSLFPQEAHPLDRSVPAGPTAADDASEGGTLRRPRAALDLTGIDWVIVGGESGSRANARPTHPEWVREIRDAVQVMGREPEPQQFAPWTRPALHFKQWGSYTPDPFGRDSAAVWVTPDGRSVTPFQADVYGLDLDGAVLMRYAGPRPGDGGKFLDGTDWCEFPETEAEVNFA